MMHLYMGDRCQFVDISKDYNKVDLVVNCGYDDSYISNYYPESKHIFLRFRNDKFDAVKLYKGLMNNSVLEYINEHILNGKNVIILGDGSYQRSAAIIGAYLIKYNHFTPDYVEEYISDKVNGIYSKFANNFRETFDMVYAGSGGSFDKTG